MCSLGTLLCGVKHWADAEPGSLLKSVLLRIGCGKLRVDASFPGRQSLEFMSLTLFERIVAREIPATIVYEDEQVLAFRDIKPQAPIHVLIIPKKPIPRIREATPEDQQILGWLLLRAAQVADQLGLSKSGYRLVFNNGPDAGEAVPHLHCHIIGGRKLGWPPG